MLVCIDWLDSTDSSSQKKWADLDPSAKVIELDEADSIDLAGVTLVLIHASVFVRDIDAELTELKTKVLSRFQGCIGIVTAGSQPHRVTDGGRVCAVRNAFPPELKTLKPKVMKLIDDLSVALSLANPKEGEIALNKAWVEFDRVSSSLETLPAIAILCQGFLAVYAAQSSDENVWRDSGVFDALNRMGWVSQDAKEGRYRIAPEVAGLDITRKVKDVQNVNGYWLDVFREHPDEASSSVVARLRVEVGQEWNMSHGGSFKYLATLLTRLEEGSLDDKNAPKDVANAYCATADQLENDS